MQDETLFLTVVKLWAATAWADGVLADNERKLLDGIIRDASVSEKTRTAALGFLQARVELEDVAVDTLSTSERSGVFRTACRLTTVDRRLDAAEKSFLDRLALRLGLDSAAAKAIEAQYLRPTSE